MTSTNDRQHCTAEITPFREDLATHFSPEFIEAIDERLMHLLLTLYVLQDLPPSAAIYLALRALDLDDAIAQLAFADAQVYLQRLDPQVTCTLMDVD